MGSALFSIWKGDHPRITGLLCRGSQWETTSEHLLPQKSSGVAVSPQELDGKCIANKLFQRLDEKPCGMKTASVDTNEEGVGLRFSLTPLPLGEVGVIPDVLS